LDPDSACERVVRVAFSLVYTAMFQSVIAVVVLPTSLTFPPYRESEHKHRDGKMRSSRVNGRASDGQLLAEVPRRSRWRRVAVFM
jgi:hypothetical protein